MDDVNAQHLAAMAITDAEVTIVAGRCDSWGPLGRCAGATDHEGSHFRGISVWANEPDYPEQKCLDPEYHGEHVYEGAASDLAAAKFACPGNRKAREGDQALPTGDLSQADAQSLVIADVTTRLAVGIERYGQGLKPFNGRKTLLDAYEESLDQTVYLRSLLAMQEATRSRLVEVVQQAFRKESQIPYAGDERRDLAEVAVDAILDAFASPRD